MSDECRLFRDRLTDLHYGELAGPGLRRTLEHLGRCRACRRLLKDFEEFDERLAAFDVPEVDVDEQVEAILERVSAEKPVARRLWEGLRSSLEPLEAMFFPGLLNLLFCFLTLGPILLGPGAASVHPTVLLVCAVLWSSVYNSIVSAVLNPGTAGWGRIDLRVVFYGVLGAMLLTHLAFFAGFHGHLLSESLAAVLALKLPDSLAACGALSLLFVGLFFGLFLRRRIFAHILMVLCIYIAVNLPAIVMFSGMAPSPSALLRLAFPVFLCGLLGAVAGHMTRGSRSFFRGLPGAGGFVRAHAAC